MLDLERDYLGYYRSGHPVGEMAREMAIYGVRGIRSWTEFPSSIVCGIVHDIRPHILHSEGGGERKMAWIEISDPTGTMEITVFSNIFEEKEAIIRSGNPVVIEIERDQYKGRWTAKAVNLWSLAEMRLRYTSAIHVLDREVSQPGVSGTLIIGDNNSEGRVVLNGKGILEVDKYVSIA